VLSKDKGESRPAEMLVELRCRYLAGSQAEYLKEESIRRVAGQVVYDIKDIKKSQTDLLSIQTGVAFRSSYQLAD
jgi:hypothetical protein